MLLTAPPPVGSGTTTFPRPTPDFKPALPRDSSHEQRVITRCPVCLGRRLHYLFSVGGYRVVRCENCTLMLSNPQPSDHDLARIYSEDYFLVEKNEAGQRHVDQLKQATADSYLDLLEKYRGTAGGKLLEIGCGQGDFLVRAQARGMEVCGVEYSEHACGLARAKLGDSGRVIRGEITDLAGEAGAYDVCALSDVIEHVRDPAAFLQRAYELLKPGGVLFIATPTLDSWSARLLKGKWMEFKPEHLWYFRSATLQTLLIRSHFADIIHQPCSKTLSFDYVAGHFARYPVPGITPLTNLVRRALPFGLRRRPVQVVASGMVLMSRKREAQERQKLSLIVPVYNEAATFEEAFDRLLAKEIPQLDIELVVVESHSTDGTRELVRQYEGHPRVKIVWEDEPRGKGHAVRAGLQVISGDYVMIQDADLEYDVEDYESLLEPLIYGRAAFVLGARHGGSAWKMRQFSDQPAVAAVLNAAHWIFTNLINVFFNARLKDPFTMYKVFRRDCLYGLKFECNRFDFDWEIVIKLLRKGFQPLEIPVNYRSRSFKEGKKVRLFLDPLTWLKTLVVCRLQTVDPLAEVVRSRQAAAK